MILTICRLSHHFGIRLYNTMNEEQLATLVRQIIHPDKEMTLEEMDQMQDEFIDSIPHPGGSDLIFYPTNWGLASLASPEEIARAALSWRPRVIVVTISYVRPHPSRSDLTCYGIEVEHELQTQVVSPLSFEVGDRCVVALSGVNLADGTVVKHEFVDGVFSSGVIISPSSELSGTEIASFK